MQTLLRWLDPILNPLACLAPMDEPEGLPENADAMLKRLDALLRQKLKYALAGEKRSMLRGQGLDFADLREYAPGDDIRKMDWSVFARTLTPHVRQYQEEKQLTLWLVLDLTPSMQFGKTRTKLGQALNLAGLFGLLAEKSGHQLGAYLMGSHSVEIIPPAGHHAHLRHLMQRMITAGSAVDNATPSGPPATDLLLQACSQLGHLVSRQNTVVLLSDFLSGSEAWQASLGQLSHQASLLSLMLIDPLETQLPEGMGILTLQDAESGQTLQVDTQDAALLKAYQNQAEVAQSKRLAFLNSVGAAALASTERDPLDIILELLKSPRMAA